MSEGAGPSSDGSKMMGIGALSRRTGLSVSAIRFYGDRGVLPPIEVDPSTGYRRFHTDQVAVGRLIRDLRSIGLPLDVVAEALALSPSERHVIVEHHVAQLEEATAAARTVARLM